MGVGKKIAGGILRFIITIIVGVIGILGILLFLTISPVYTYSIIGEIPLVGQIHETLGAGFEPFKFIFGGEGMMYLTSSGDNIGQIEQEVVATLNVDYFAIIGFVFAILTVLLFIFSYNHKGLMFTTSFLSIVAIVFGFTSGLTFNFVNGDVINSELIGVLEKILGVFRFEQVINVIPVGGIIMGVCFIIIFIISLIRAFTIRKR